MEQSSRAVALGRETIPTDRLMGQSALQLTLCGTARQQKHFIHSTTQEKKQKNKLVNKKKQTNSTEDCSAKNWNWNFKCDEYEEEQHARDESEHEDEDDARAA